MYYGFFFSQQQELSSKVFAHLCEVVDDNKQFYDEKIHQISKLIILEGKAGKTAKRLFVSHIFLTVYIVSLHSRFTSLL